MRIVLLGGGGFALEMLDLAETLGHEVVAVFDERGTSDRAVLREIGVTDSLDGIDADAAAVAVGDPFTRQRFWDIARERFETPTLIHPTACVSGRATVGAGCAIMQNTVVNAETRIGEGTLLNVACCIGHESVVGAFCHIAPSVNLSGCSAVGDRTMLGTGVVVLPGIKVGSDCMCGAGAVVTRDIGSNVLVTGVPARHVRSLSEEYTA